MIQILNIKELPDGSAEIEMDISEELYDFFKKESLRYSKSIEDLMVDYLRDYINKIK